MDMLLGLDMLKRHQVCALSLLDRTRPPGPVPCHKRVACPVPPSVFHRPEEERASDRHHGHRRHRDTLPAGGGASRVRPAGVRAGGSRGLAAGGDGGQGAGGGPPEVHTGER